MYFSCMYTTVQIIYTHEEELDIKAIFKKKKRGGQIVRK